MLNTEMTMAQALHDAVDTREEQEALVFGEVRFVTRFPCSQFGKVQKFKLWAGVLQEMEGREPI